MCAERFKAHDQTDSEHSIGILWLAFPIESRMFYHADYTCTMFTDHEESASILKSLKNKEIERKLQCIDRGRN